MPKRYIFNTPILETIVGGKSVLDMPKLNFKTLSEIDAFLAGYGFDVNKPHDLEKLWYFHRRALVLLQEKLGFPAESFPEVLKDPKLLEDPRKLLLMASSHNESEKELQRWSCALLRAMHVFVHIENDLFASFAEEIQKQILSPFQACVFHDGASGKTFLKKASDKTAETDVEKSEGSLPLFGFESKPFKTSSSAVIKLLAKPDALAMNIYDKIGVRFVTSNMFDCFRVIRLLVEEDLISFPHIMPDQSSNNLYPSDLFLSGVNKIIEKNIVLSDHETQEFFIRHFEENKQSASFIRKENYFSGADYKFIKFISRKLIRIEMPGYKDGFSFFYPFEVQIMDKLAHESILSGPSEHQAYKQRQKQAARERIMPDLRLANEKEQR